MNITNESLYPVETPFPFPEDGYPDKQSVIKAVNDYALSNNFTIKIKDGKFPILHLACSKAGAYRDKRNISDDKRKRAPNSSLIGCPYVLRFSFKRNNMRYLPLPTRGKNENCHNHPITPENLASSHQGRMYLLATSSRTNEVAATESVSSISVQEPVQWTKSIDRLEHLFRHCEGEQQVRALMTKVDDLIDNAEKNTGNPGSVSTLANKKALGRRKMVKRRSVLPNHSVLDKQKYRLIQRSLTSLKNIVRKEVNTSIKEYFEENYP
ncbi:hypothetical protein CLU79DRAFT_835613 [Phycomyces nitens]|nr:hypothetical protein CLU79DRAFT_835613 [Phycomyces nitens]